MKKEKIGILLGGVSAEHEVSLLSGQSVFDRINKKRFKPCKLLINKDGSFGFALQKLKSMDTVFIALHGKNGEDGKIQGFLETLDLSYTGPGVKASAICIDKYISKKIWKAQNLPVTATHIVQNLKQCLNHEPPFVLKPRSEGSSVGISIVKKENDTKGAFEKAREFGDVLLEKYIKGRELTVGVIGSNNGLKTLPIVEIKPKTEFYDYEAKYKRDDTEYVVPAKLPKNISTKITSIAVKACQTVGIKTFSRVDFLLDQQQEPYLLEINTIPGLTSHSLLPKAARAAGTNFKDLLTKMILVSQKIHDHRK